MYVLRSALLVAALCLASAQPVAASGQSVRGVLDRAARSISPPLRQTLAEKPSPWIVKVHDVGVPTDVHRDVPWHLLDKEKDPRFDLPHRGKLGAFNPNADIHWLIGLGVDGRETDFNPPRRYIDHLANIAAQEIQLGGGIQCHVLFLPVASDTLLAIIDLSNESQVAHPVLVESVFTKPAGNGKPAIEEAAAAWNRPVDRYGYGITVTTGDIERFECLGENAVVGCFSDLNDKKQQVGSLLATLAGDASPGSTRIQPDFPLGPTAAMVYDYALGPGQSVQLRLALNIHRFASERQETRNQIVLHPAERIDDARHYALESARAALKCDWAELVNASFNWYERMPVVRLPHKSWEAGFCCALELPRGNTFSAQGVLEQPWYTFCRVHGHEPYGWWSYGMHAHEHLCTHVVNISEPALSQSFLRGHFNAQKSDGFIQYGINPSGRNFHEPLATAPLLSGESWQAYLWSGDRQFLAEAYDKCGPFVRWWRSSERTQAGLQHWRDFVESLRDDKDLATWTATKGAENQAALDLNCYLLNEERMLARMARELGKFREAGQWQAEADARIATMRDTLWHDGDGVYYGKNLRTAEWAQVMDISTFFPLWCGLATPDQAKSIARLLHDPDTFGTRYPVATLAAKEMPDKLRGQYHWRGANWVEMSWLAIQGLAENGYDREAARVAMANCEMVFNTLEKTGHFREFYNSLTGEPSDLTDYIWSSMPAIMIVETWFGIRPTGPGLQIHPRLPADWDDIRIDNLHVRGARISLHVKRNASWGASRVIVNGAARLVEDDGSLLLPWAELPARCDIEIAQGPE